MHSVIHVILRILLVVALVYLAAGLGFHFTSKREQEACRQARLAAGEFVEPEVFAGPLALAFDVTFWPVYVWANVYHDGTPFATPCTH